eukprot:scaffold647867_cov34-Prasinocladus_malaysianus.AAC.1
MLFVVVDDVNVALYVVIVLAVFLDDDGDDDDNLMANNGPSSEDTRDPGGDTDAKTEEEAAAAAAQGEAKESPQPKGPADRKDKTKEADPKDASAKPKGKPRASPSLGSRSAFLSYPDQNKASPKEQRTDSRGPPTFEGLNASEKRAAGGKNSTDQAAQVLHALQQRQVCWQVSRPATAPHS